MPDNAIQTQAISEYDKNYPDKTHGKQVLTFCDVCCRTLNCDKEKKKIKQAKGNKKSFS